MERLKRIAKSVMALLFIAIMVMVFTRIFDEMYDFRLILAAAGGAFGYEPLCGLLNKIKGLQ